MNEVRDEFMNDERCTLLFHTIELLLKDYISLLAAVSGFAAAKEKIEKHTEVAKDVLTFIAQLNRAIKEEDDEAKKEEEK